MTVDEKLDYIINTLGLKEDNSERNKEEKVEECIQSMGKGFRRVNIFQIQRIIRHELSNDLNDHELSKRVLSGDLTVNRALKIITNGYDNDPTFVNRIYVASLSLVEEFRDLPFDGLFRKIGKTEDLKNRWKTMERGLYLSSGTKTPFTYSFLMTWDLENEDDIPALERYIIDNLSLNRERCGEWFLDPGNNLTRDVNELVEKFKNI